MCKEYTLEKKFLVFRVIGTVFLCRRSISNCDHYDRGSIKRGDKARSFPRAYNYLGRTFSKVSPRMRHVRTQYDVVIFSSTTAENRWTRELKKTGVLYLCWFFLLETAVSEWLHCSPLFFFCKKYSSPLVISSKWLATYDLFFPYFYVRITMCVSLEPTSR